LKGRGKGKGLCLPSFHNERAGGVVTRKEYSGQFLSFASISSRGEKKKEKEAIQFPFNFFQ